MYFISAKHSLGQLASVQEGFLPRRRGPSLLPTAVTALDGSYNDAAFASSAKILSCRCDVNWKPAPCETAESNRNGKIPNSR